MNEILLTNNSVADFTFMRSIYSLSFSVIVTLLHISCCLLPLVSIASVSVGHTTFFAEHQIFFQTLQWGLMLWLTWRILAFYVFHKGFHNRTELLSYCLSWLIAVAGLIINYYEPFKSEDQVLAGRHFERFKNNRQLRICLSVSCDKRRLVHDLCRINGVKEGSVNVEVHAVTLSYHKNIVTADHIYTVLRKKGYLIK